MYYRREEQTVNEVAMLWRNRPLMKSFVMLPRMMAMRGKPAPTPAAATDPTRIRNLSRHVAKEN